MAWISLAVNLNAEVMLEPPTVVERGPHWSVVQWVTQETDPAGNIVNIPHSITELASGLNVLRDGTWQPAKAEFEVLPGAFVARQGQFRVILNTNANCAGVVDLLMPDGQTRLRASLLSLRYHDLASGQSVTLGTIQDSQGQWLDPTMVAYTSALSGLEADLVYKLGLGKFEQDLVLRRRPPDPELFKLNPATTVIEIWTEFYQPPTPNKTETVWPVETDPQKRQAMAEPDLVNEFLDFGSMQMPSGKAFVSGTADSRARPVA
ncbi:MAG: hypothetical protein M1608_18175, partial [Candidatus Omnitrophica bacterium]|nr:hypothetical protein [Candidatus Omnitrophota bacterium]